MLQGINSKLILQGQGCFLIIVSQSEIPRLNRNTDSTAFDGDGGKERVEDGERRGRRETKGFTTLGYYIGDKEQGGRKGDK